MKDKFYVIECHLNHTQMTHVKEMVYVGGGNSLCKEYMPAKQKQGASLSFSLFLSLCLPSTAVAFSSTPHKSKPEE